MTDPQDAIQARTRILAAATALFAQQGFDGTSTARIARTAGVPKGLLFYYFPTKPDILSALMTEGLGKREIDPAPLAVPGNPVQALLNIGERILANHAASDLLREIIWHESHTRPEVSAALTRYRQSLHSAIENVLIRSLTGPVTDSALRAAASAWSATITARPLATHASDATHAADATHSPGIPHSTNVARGAGALHGSESLRSIAELLCAGLHAQIVSPQS